MNEFGCLHCGAINENHPVLVEKDKRIDMLLGENVKLRAENSRLKGEHRSDRRFDPHYADAMEVWEYWRKVHSPQAREFGDERWTHVRARLAAGFTVKEIKRAIDGAKAKPYQGRRRTELANICRSEKMLQMFLDFADEAMPVAPAVIPGKRLAVMQQALDNPSVLKRLHELRGWTPEAMLSLGLGLEGDRVVFPLHDAEGRLVGIGRYQPNEALRNGHPKLIAQGVRELFPPPETIRTEIVYLVEGEADAVAIRSAGLWAVGAPGVNTWKAEWPQRFSEFTRVLICFDCDKQGREAAEERRESLVPYTDPVVIDLDDKRGDGYDVGDLLLEYGKSTAQQLSKRSSLYGNTMMGGREPDPTPPFERVTAALRRCNQRVQLSADGKAYATCANHDDRHPSLTVGVGEDDRALVRCHAGCTQEEAVHAIGLEMRDLFPG